ncbi:HGL080Cp [Eremothecium sinecaudum]|uniref:HGL080Cp n=1 Tax=Eremothecium sinecaudum TaxID=45286 RepID=A0A120K2Q3_9SACH|nr:HGL080Cp [Eremothecium sinecaudum]AMD22260.1 HGL080Cp [Eremothecium sinecaudum]
MVQVPIDGKQQQTLDDSVPETINAALDQLHLDDLEGPKGVGSVKVQDSSTVVPGAGPNEMHRQHNGLFPPPHPQMMNPFLPYPLMHIPHHNGFFPLGDGPMLPPDSSAAGDFNNPVVPTPPQTSALDVVPEPLWSASQDYQFIHGSSFADTPAVEGEGAAVTAGLKEGEKMPTNDLGVAHRRQNFHAIVNSDLLADTSAAQLGKTDISKDKSKNESSKESEFGSGNYPQAAYPYGTGLLEPNPALAGHHPPSGPGPNYGILSPFPGYGFTSPFSPIPGTSPIAANQQRNGMPSHSNIPSHNDNVSPNIEGANGWRYPHPGSHPFAGHMVPHSQMMGGPNGSPHYHSIPHSRNGQNGKRSHANNGQQNNGMRNMNQGGKLRGNHHHYHHHNRPDEAARYADSKLEDYIGKIYSLCKDQHGCRFLQKQLDIGGPEAATAIFEETKQYVVELMTDSFGNYLIQKLVERIDEEQRITLVKSSASKLVAIALDPHGTRALQKLVEYINTEMESEIIINSLRDSVVHLSRDLNGNHVIQKCLQKLEPKDCQFIFDAACQECVKIATHRHGCCVLQRCLDHSSNEQRKQLCETIIQNVNSLTLDPFGNYVVQYILSKEAELATDYEYTNKIFNILKPRIIELSLHKFGSNVVEKILRTPEVAETMITELLNVGGQIGIGQLLHDGYGNYVLQTALEVAKLSNNYLYHRLTELLKPILVGPIRNTPHGRRIMSILQIE